MNSAGVAAFSDSLRNVEAPDHLFPLAATAAALAATSPSVGALCVAHAMLLILGGQADDAIPPDEWTRIRVACGLLAAFVDHPDITRLNALGAAWRAIVAPSALQ